MTVKDPGIRTSRLLLKPLSIDDLSFMVRMQSDPEVMKHIGGGGVRTPELVRANVERNLNLRLNHPLLGQWIIRIAESGQEIGSILLRPPATATPERGVEIGYSLLTEAWGKGYATEAVRAMIDYVALNMAGESVMAMVSPTHPSSIKVLEKAGMQAAGESVYLSPVNGETLNCLLFRLETPCPTK